MMNSRTLPVLTGRIFFFLTTSTSPIRRRIPNIAATIVRDENPAEGWVAGCAGTSVVWLTTGVRETVSTTGY